MNTLKEQIENSELSSEVIVENILDRPEPYSVEQNLDECKKYVSKLTQIANSLSSTINGLSTIADLQAKKEELCMLFDNLEEASRKTRRSSVRYY
jgi:hypothetical protein